MDACNGQGESLVHLACRRHQNTALLHFIVDEAGVSLQVQDDWGKTPLHEFAWNRKTKPATSSAVRLILQKAPELLFVQDKRNYSALQYVPQDAWEDWCIILRQHKALIRYQALRVAHQQSKRDLQARVIQAQDMLGHR